MQLFDQLAEQYDFSRFIPEKALEMVVRDLERFGGMNRESRVLEIGVGTGRIAMPFVQRGYHYTGIDVSGKMLDKFIAKFDGVLPSRLTLLRADAQELPLVSGMFTHVLAYHVLYFIADVRRCMQESMRVLADGGSFLHGDEIFIDCEWMDRLNRLWYEMVSEHSPQLRDMLREANPALSDKEDAVHRMMDQLRRVGYRMRLKRGHSWVCRIGKEDYLSYYRDRKDSFSTHMTKRETMDIYRQWKEAVNKSWEDGRPRLARKQLFVMLCRKE